MRNKTYLAVFEPAEGGAYSVYFPHVLGCVSYGKDFIDAQKMAKEALELHIYGMEKDGEKLPVEEFSGIQTNDGDIVCAITIYPDLVKNEIDSRRVRTNCTIPYGLKLKAEQQGINFFSSLGNIIKRIGIMIKHMEYAYSIRSIDKLKEYNLFLETHKGKIAAYIDFIQNSYSVKDLPEYIVFADFDMATRVHRSISIPAYTNEIRMVITPELNIWKSIYLKQLEVYEIKAVENIQSYYSNDINENSILQIIGHELMHQSELFLDDFEDEKKLTEGIWFEEGMVEYISKKFFLTTEEFEKEKQINTSLVKLFEEKYGISSIESFGQETYDENYTSIFYNYWRSFLAIDILVQKFHIVSKVFEHYHNWNKAGRTMPLSKWFQIE